MDEAEWSGALGAAVGMGMWASLVVLDSVGYRER